MKYVNDVRKSSHDPRTANPAGYQGTIDDALAQIRAEEDVPNDAGTGREQLLKFLRCEPEVKVLQHLYPKLCQGVGDVSVLLEQQALDQWIADRTIDAQVERMYADEPLTQQGFAQ
jgi:hypothetical protein